MLRRFPIGLQVAALVALTVLLLAATAGVAIHNYALRAMSESLKLKGVAIAKTLGEQSAEPLVTEGWWELHRLVSATLRADPDVRYAFITDATGRVVAHSFAEGFPQGLAAANQAKGRDPHSALLQTEEGLVEDIALPLLDGQAGTARVGMSLRRSEQMLNVIRRWFLTLAGVVLVFGVIAALATAHLVTRPLRQMAAAARAVAKGDWDQEVTTRGGDEVADLGRAFSHMLEQLRDSRRRLEQDAKRIEDQALDNARLFGEVREELRLRQDLQQQLIQSAKLAAIGTLTAGVAHELNQPLTVIRALSQELREASASGEETALLLTDIEQQTTRLMRIIEHLRAFSRDSRAERAPMQVNASVEEALGMIRQQLHHRGVELELELAGSLPLILGSVTQIEQVTLNLLSNARDAVAEVPRPEIRIRTTEACRLDAAVTPGVVLEVSDNGPGLPAVHRDRVFEPFFTTKEAGHGTGLGLSVSHGIVADHGGWIEVDSEEGRGATFRVWLPCAPVEAAVEVRSG